MICVVEPFPNKGENLFHLDKMRLKDKIEKMDKMLLKDKTER